MPAQVICKIKKWKNYALNNVIYGQFSTINQCSRICNTEVNNPIRLEFELIWDFMPVLDTCKFGKDPIKNDREKVETLFSSL